MNNVYTTDVELVAERSGQGHYDYIIVGSGLGGGLLANELVLQRQNVLLIERGGLLFPTHCLNLSRPHWEVGSPLGPSQDNDIVYAAHKSPVETAQGSDPYVGGPVYGLGGRSTTWGLYSPMIDKSTIAKYFPHDTAEFLHRKGFQKGFEIFTNGSQKADAVFPTDKDLNSKDQQAFTDAEISLNQAVKTFYQQHPPGEAPSWKKAPLAAEFRSHDVYQFPQGAYSTVDAILEHLYAQNPHLTLLLDSQVQSLGCEQPGHVSSVRIRTNGQDYRLSATKGVILAAGTIGTPVIAFNSGLQKGLPLIGKGLTDHEIWGVRFLKENKDGGQSYPPMKLQCNINIEGAPALLNVAINANSLLGRKVTEFDMPAQAFRHDGTLFDDVPKHKANGTKHLDTVNVTLEFLAELDDDSEVINVASTKPVIKISRPAPRSNEVSLNVMQDLVTDIRNALLGIKPEEKLPRAPRPSLAGFGVVAHEVGTMRIHRPGQTGVTDENYRVDGYDNLYVCDLSLFPVSAPANPSLTLAGIALHLAEKLMAKA